MLNRTVHEHLAPDLLGELSKEDHDPGSPALANALLCDAVRQRATDVHVEPRHGNAAVVRFRIDGALLDTVVLPRDVIAHLENQFKVLARLDPLPAVKPQSARWTASFDGRKFDVRLSAISALSGERLTLRLLDPQRFGVSADDKLLLDPDRLGPLMRCLIQREGMLLVTGPTGCGKTTTVYSLMRRLAAEPRSVFAIEDPPEFAIPGVTQIAVDPEHGVSFPEGIRAALRMDPDYLLVGELRDRQSVRAALDAATTGCVVFGTLHARDAAGAVTSLRKWNADNYELSTLLSIVVAQRLVRRLCEGCRCQQPPDETERSWFEWIGIDAPQQVFRAAGCPSCHQLGYQGRVAVFETWTLEEPDRQRILNEADERELRRYLAERGHQFLMADALQKVAAGVTDIAEIRRMGGFGPCLEAVKWAKPGEVETVG